MSVQYAGGTNVNTTFTCTVGTRREIVDGLVAALTTAGWSTVSGGGTGTVVMRSTTTPTASNVIDVRIHDPGSGNCAQIRMQNAAATLLATALFLLPAAGKVFRVIANKYQFFIFTDGGTVDARGWAMVSVPFIPSFLHGVIAGEFGVCMGNAESDTATTARSTFRTGPGAVTSGSTIMNWSAIMNGVLHTRTGNSSDWCDLRTVLPASSWKEDYNNPMPWHDGSLLLSEPLLAWGMTDAEPAKIRGQIWDAIWCSEMFAADLSTFSFDSHAWYSMTNNNPGYTNYVRGTLLVVIP